ncbi:membrane-spanning 4-domains subfamily A member 4A-like [Polymixia lowei]
MAVDVTRNQETIVCTLSLTYDNKATCPAFCQILGSLCYSPVCCSVPQGLKRLQANTQSALGTIQIMAGLLNIGAGMIVINENSWFVRSLRAPYWLGAMFIAVGIICILAEKFPSMCLVITSAAMNLLGATLAITGIVLYAIDLGDDKLNYWYRNLMSTKENNFEGNDELKYIIMILLGGLDALLIVLSVLQLCVTISSAVLSINALCKYREDQNETAEEVEYKPLLKITTTNTGV